MKQLLETTSYPATLVHEGLALVEAFVLIESPEDRRSILDLARMLAAEREAGPRTAILDGDVAP